MVPRTRFKSTRGSPAPKLRVATRTPSTTMNSVDPCAERPGRLLVEYACFALGSRISFFESDSECHPPDKVIERLPVEWTAFAALQVFHIMKASTASMTRAHTTSERLIRSWPPT